MSVTEMPPLKLVCGGVNYKRGRTPLCVRKTVEVEHPRSGSSVGPTLVALLPKEEAGVCYAECTNADAKDRRRSGPLAPAAGNSGASKDTSLQRPPQC